MSTPVVRHSSKGFTLLEILVASAITALLLALVVGVVNGVIENSRHIRRGSEAEKEASLALDIMAADFEAMLIQQQESGASLLLVMEEVNGVVVPWISLLSSAPDADGGAYPLTPRAISLRVGYKDPVANSIENPRFGLYRAVASGRDTFTRALGLANPQADFWSADGGIATTDWKDLLTDHLCELQVRFQLAEGGQWIDPQTRGTVMRLDRNGVYFAESGGTETLISQGMNAIEISLVLLDKNVDRRVQEGVQTRQEAAKRDGYHFARRTVLVPRGIQHRMAVAP